jgi:hypothetical protein
MTVNTGVYVMGSGLPEKIVATRAISVFESPLKLIHSVSRFFVKIVWRFLILQGTPDEH